jgi:hypothetical protein
MRSTLNRQEDMHTSKAGKPLSEFKEKACAQYRGYNSFLVTSESSFAKLSHNIHSKISLFIVDLKLETKFEA